MTVFKLSLSIRGMNPCKHSYYVIKLNIVLVYYCYFCITLITHLFYALYSDNYWDIRGVSHISCTSIFLAYIIWYCLLLRFPWISPSPNQPYKYVSTQKGSTWSCTRENGMKNWRFIRDDESNIDSGMFIIWRKHAIVCIRTCMNEQRNALIVIRMALKNIYASVWVI